MPMSDGFFTQFPAEQDSLPFDIARKVQQADIEILHLNSSGVDLRDSVFGSLLSLHSFRSSLRQRHNIERHSAVQKDTVMQHLLLSIGIFDEFLGVDCGPQ